ncbi:MAG: aldehyde dehydrogenase family protein, partial [Candidatus Rokubacteria bacterium]|nr:aldehyde dehydrogenase family protein [Candidatus Rokubacteria bacterium]
AGTLYRPALVYPVAPQAMLATAEQFGPILPVSVFDDVDEVLASLDRSDVGQQASVFGRDKATVGRLVDHLTNLVCRVNLNTQCRRGPDVLPFTGRKGSALGTLSVNDALRTFSIRSLVAVKAAEQAFLDDLGSHSSFLG